MSQITFTFEGRTITAAPGQSIAAALYASGIRNFSRSFKYHRPRGLLCCSGDCPNCLMEVDGRPNVTTCLETAKQGQIVRRQNAWPNADQDWLRVFDKLARFLPIGFYYKNFHKPRWLWPIFEFFVRRIAGLGRVDVSASPQVETDSEYLHADVCVVGGGPAGMAASKSAAEAGARVLLLERQSVLGGQTLFSHSTPEHMRPGEDELFRNPKVHVLCDTTVFGLYEGNLLGAFQGNRLLKIRARQIIVATGGRERPFVFQNNDLPGVFLSRGVLRLSQLHGVKAGSRAVVLTDNDRGHELVNSLRAAGIDVVALVDHRTSRPPNTSQSTGRAESAEAAVHLGSTIVEARGRGAVTSVLVAPIRGSQEVDLQASLEVQCDLLCLASEIQPSNELLLQGGVTFRQQGSEWRTVRTVPGIQAAGDAAGTRGLAGHIAEGKLRGAEAAHELGFAVPDLDALRREFQAADQRVSNDDPAVPMPKSTGGICPSAGSNLNKRFVCFCEDVTDRDLERGIREGFDHIETLKRYSTVNMGPCQGKMCGRLAVEVASLVSGQDTNAVGMTTSRPPVVPVEMCVLAAAARHPVRRTPLHHWHASAGVKWLDAGQWKRPESYGDVAAEVRAVRNHAGLIDVSTLGKIEVFGPDAGELLDRIYLNAWSDLKPGRVRYGVMCNEDGIVLDDGVGARLDAHSFYLTTTTGNAEGVLQWLERWRATWRLNASIVNLTSSYAAINLAGPKSREVLARLTSLDTSTKSFPYMSMREADIASVPCRLFRIGFVGELGYEIHCGNSSAWGLWERIYDAGKDIGLQPFGVEAQRVLRLEKGHFIVGADTDALSNPLDVGLSWMIKLERPKFIGRDPLRRLKERGSSSCLVGFEISQQDSMTAAHATTMEGCQVVSNGRSAGRVTSARLSPTLNRIIGLAWVPGASSAPGKGFTIRWNGTDIPANVAQLPFYDPDGVRLKS